MLTDSGVTGNQTDTNHLRKWPASLRRTVEPPRKACAELLAFDRQFGGKQNVDHKVETQILSEPAGQ